MQGVWAPCAVQGEDEAVSFFFPILTLILGLVEGPCMD
jgi:hypothetical protein